MRNIRLRSDLKRAVVDGFAFPLGIEPGDLKAPTQGYTIAFTPGEEGEPDSYVFHVVVSHERLAPILYKAFDLLPREIFGIVEIGSRDAYRSVDVYMGQEMVSRERFLRTWRAFEPLLMEDGSIAAGANSEDPFVEVFLDHWKGFYIHVPTDARDEVESMLHSMSLEEVPQTWQEPDDEKAAASTELRPVLASNGAVPADIDELLLQLRRAWRLELNVDPESNVDDAGRELGLTLWHAIVTIDDRSSGRTARSDVSVWATASSLSQMQQIMDDVLEEHPQWEFVDTFAIDRVAYDERPDELADLPPRRTQTQVHLVSLEPWQESSEDEGRGRDRSGPPGPSGPDAAGEARRE